MQIGRTHEALVIRRQFYGLVGAVVAAALGWGLLLVLLFGPAATRRMQPVANLLSVPGRTADAAQAQPAPWQAQFKSMQAQLDKNSQELAALRARADFLMTDLASLREQREADQAALAARRVQPEPAPRPTPEAAVAGPVAAVSGPRPAAPSAAHRPPPHHVARAVAVRPQEQEQETVVIDGVPYVKGREPHPLPGHDDLPIPEDPNNGPDSQ
jgi:hypothetical protein